MPKSKILLAAMPLILLLAGGLIYEYGYLRIQDDLAVIREEQAAKSRTLKKALAIIAEKPELEKRLKALRDLRQADNAKLMGGEMPSLASASLQDTIKGIVTNRGGTVSSARVGKVEDIIYQEPGTEKAGPETRERKAPADKKGAKPAGAGAGKFKIINASLDIVVPDPAALRDILFFIETRTPYLVVREVDARVRNMKEPRELVVRLDVAALYGG